MIGSYYMTSIPKIILLQLSSKLVKYFSLKSIIYQSYIDKLLLKIKQVFKTNHSLYIEFTYLFKVIIYFYMGIIAKNMAS